MPLKPGRGKNVIAENIREFHHGRTYAATKAKHGKATADKQAVAAAFHASREGKK